MKDPKSFYRKVFAKSPVGMAIYDSTGKCIDSNEVICKMVGATKKQVLAQNFHNIESWKKAGLYDKAIEALEKNKSTNLKYRLISSFGKELNANTCFLPFKSGSEKYLLLTVDDLSDFKKLEDEREKLIKELQGALKEIKTLRSIIPICSYCKKIRDDKGYWEQVEVYIKKHLFAELTHGICPNCIEIYFPGMEIGNNDKSD